ncbi:hypothetical protein SK128_001698 [Halocaridina rubra]|uniref:C-type lectin domain-containing protein n=1 Tax=Halocaridina rubra TaxID=373956 RepID=A0AAN9AE12_HALRR
MFKALVILSFWGFAVGKSAPREGNQKAGCPPFFEDILGKCFFFSTTMGNDERTWHSSRDYCHSLSTEYNTELAVMGYACNEDEALLQAIADKGITKAWIGASDINVEGEWEWVDGRIVDLKSHSWSPTMPTDSTLSNCGVIEHYPDHNKMYLGDDSCLVEHLYICETNITASAKATLY